jgi:hypothetical protein
MLKQNTTQHITGVERAQIEDNNNNNTTEEKAVKQ